MGYFQQFLKGSQEDQLDIAVHCDLKIFEWLLKYCDFLYNKDTHGDNKNQYKLSYQVMLDHSEI